MKIDIQINDVRYVADIGPIVDSPAFSLESKKLRDKFNIYNLLSREEYSSYKRSVYGTQTAEILSNEIELARKGLRLPVTFKKVIEYGSFCGVIKEGDYLPAYLENKVDFFDDKGEIPDDTYFIVLSPKVKNRDVLRALYEYRDHLGNLKSVEEYRYIPLIRNLKISLKKVKEHRDWYLWNKEDGLSIKEVDSKIVGLCPIHGSEYNRSKKCSCKDVKTIRDGIESYEKLVKGI